MSKRLISYVFPIYNESDTISVLYQTVLKVLADKNKYEYEFLFVNDGSNDESLNILISLQTRDRRVIVIDLARNYGHQIAVIAGLEASRGDAVIIMDSDMQDPPRVSLELIDKWEEGYEVVYAQRRSRKDSAFKRVTASGFYYILEKVADIKIPRNTGDFRLIDRVVVDELKRFKEHSPFLRGMVSYIGFKQTAVQFDRDERHAGISGYPLRKMVRFASDGILSFSSAPLRLISKTGYAMAGLSFIGILYVLAVKLYYPETVVEGWAFIVISILFIGGIQLIMLGIIGSYLGRVYTETQQRPLYGVRSIYKRDPR